MQFYDWLSSVKNWALSWFSDANKAKLLAILNMASVYIDEAMPIVRKIDEELKPILKGGEIPALKAIQDFLEAHSTDMKNVVDVAKRLVELPMADMLANIALEILKSGSPTNVSLSILRLAIELAYNIYKTSKVKPV